MQVAGARAQAVAVIAEQQRLTAPNIPEPPEDR
jgi:hypothetical protein